MRESSGPRYSRTLLDQSSREKCDINSRGFVMCLGVLDSVNFWQNLFITSQNGHPSTDELRSSKKECVTSTFGDIGNVNRVQFRSFPLREWNRLFSCDGSSIDSARNLC
uniref:AlNc14C292G10248 protein n=1 Tax=Albugo laibachii Nc14 TaxID=890382 RepID=F0WVA3_9STRA|nr:AlNc14C292G10248 [Albugo laibachii Nc14]|eukprot:CCA25342.1 AlNc14C292G10248 [Albugo laibachii Nc14]